MKTLVLLGRKSISVNSVQGSECTKDTENENENLKQDTQTGIKSHSTLPSSVVEAMVDLL